MERRRRRNYTFLCLNKFICTWSLVGLITTTTTATTTLNIPQHRATFRVLPPFSEAVWWLIFVILQVFVCEKRSFMKRNLAGSVLLPRQSFPKVSQAHPARYQTFVPPLSRERGHESVYAMLHKRIFSNKLRCIKNSS